MMKPCYTELLHTRLILMGAVHIEETKARELEDRLSIRSKVFFYALTENKK